MPRKWKYITLFSSILIMLTIVATWIASNGLPYFKDNNESYLSYVHGLNLLKYNPANFSFLTAEDTNPSTETELPDKSLTPGSIYTHNPNFPRYLHALLLSIDIFDFRMHILIIGLLSAMSTTFLMYSFLHRIGAPYYVAFILFILLLADLRGFDAFLTNTYRCWSFTLFFGVYYSLVLKNWRVPVFLSFFILFQFEYGFAIFLASSACVFSILNEGKSSIKKIAYAFIGAIVSIILFCIQLVTYKGLDGLTHDFLETLDRRSGVKYDYNNFLSDLFNQINAQIGSVFEIYSIVVWMSVGLCIITYLLIPFIHKRKSIVKPCFPFLQKITSWVISVVIGGLVAAILLPGYVTDAYVSYGFPFIIFLTSLSTISLFSIFYGVSEIFLSAHTNKFHRLFVINFNLIAMVFFTSMLIGTSAVYYCTYPLISGEYINFLKIYKEDSIFLIDGVF